MNCLRCNTENEEGAKFCKNCGMDMTYTPSNENITSNQTINQLLILLGLQAFISICYFILYVIRPIFFEDNWETMNSIYDYSGWISDILSILAFLIFSILTKHKNVRIFLIIFLVIRIVLLIGYRVYDKV